MKRQISNIAATLSLLVILGVVATAQTTREMTVTVAFPFTVGKKALPAGTYTLFRTSTSTGDQFLLRDANGRAKVVFNTRQAQSRESRGVGRLEFRRYDDKYFLARIWPEGNNIGRELQQGRLEREIAQNSSPRMPKGVQPEVVTVTIQ